MRNLRPEKIDSRASKASDADSPQRLRACVEAVSHRQRRSTNPPRLKSSAGKGKPGQHNKQSNSHYPAFQQTNPLLAPQRNHGSNTVQNKEAPPHRGYLCSPTHQNRPKQPHLYPPHKRNKWNIRNKWNTHTPLKSSIPPYRTTPPKPLNQTTQPTDKQCVCGRGAGQSAGSRGYPQLIRRREAGTAQIIHKGPPRLTDRSFSLGGRCAVFGVVGVGGCCC